MNRLNKTLCAAIILVLSTALLSGCSLNKNTEQAYKSNLSEARSKHEDHYYAQAILSFNKAAEADPKKSEPYEGIVGILVEKGLYDDAKSVISKSASSLKSQEKASLYVLLASAYYSNNEFDDAKDFYETALDLDSSNTEARVGLAQSFTQLGDLKDATKTLDLEKLDNESPFYAGGVLLKAYLSLENLNDAEISLKYIEDSAEESPENYPNYLSYKDAISKIGENKIYNSALLAREYINAGYPTLAIETLKPLEKSMENYWDGWFLLGSAYHNKGDYKNAKTYFAKAIELGADSSDLYLANARNEVALKDLNSAYKYYSLAMEFSNDGKIGIVSEYVRLLMENNSKVQAKEVLDSLSSEGGNPDIELLYVKMFYEDGNREDLKVHLDKLSQMSSLSDSQQKEYLYNLAVYQIEGDEFEAAEESIASLENFDKYSPELYYLKGKLAFQTDDKEAKQLLERAVDLDIEGAVSEKALKLISRIE